MSGPSCGNLYAALPEVGSAAELFTTLLDLPGVRVERIVSTGQASPPGFWYDQTEHEWVVVICGAAVLVLEGEPAPRRLGPGDYLHIPPHCRHRVEWTDPTQATIWIAVFAAGLPA
ncbi:MAG: cupin domain-containing protein [Rhodocyclaceae bacterium]|nr:cupin domain-containing protein [Rhodocyclaceae bacterium]MBX3666897.1 cupin domain-containing protein [Rhodocyclaceae bacterium]